LIDQSAALTAVMERGDEWQSWRALRLDGQTGAEVPGIPTQDPEGGFVGSTGRVSPGATGEALCHLATIRLLDSGQAAIAGDWLAEARTPAQAWLDSPDDVPGPIDDPAGGRVWATAAAVCGLLVIGGDPGPRALTLVRSEADSEGRFTGGAYPTFAATGAFWLAEGPQNEIAEWGLRWAREWAEEWWGPWEWVTGLTFWAAAGVPPDHPTVESFLDQLVDGAPAEGWPDDVELTVRALEIARYLGG
jgi:hypothetical protein